MQGSDDDKEVAALVPLSVLDADADNKEIDELEAMLKELVLKTNKSIDDAEKSLDDTIKYLEKSIKRQI